MIQQPGAVAQTLGDSADVKILSKYSQKSLPVGRLGRRNVRGILPQLKRLADVRVKAPV